VAGELFSRFEGCGPSSFPLVDTQDLVHGQELSMGELVEVDDLLLEVEGMDVALVHGLDEIGADGLKFFFSLTALLDSSHDVINTCHSLHVLVKGGGLAVFIPHEEVLAVGTGLLVRCHELADSAGLPACELRVGLGRLTVRFYKHGKLLLD
jgi:hypothetical protein